MFYCYYYSLCYSIYYLLWNCCNWLSEWRVSVSLWFVPYLFRSLLILAQLCAGTERTKCYRNAPITTWPPNSPLPHAHCPWNTEQSLTNIDRGPPQCECISSTIKPKCDIRSSRLIDTLSSIIFFHEDTFIFAYSFRKILRRDYCKKTSTKKK